MTEYPKTERAKAHWAAAAVGLLALGLRAYAFTRFRPGLWPDSQGYLEMAESLVRSGHFAGEAGLTGARPPVYPLFLAAFHGPLARADYQPVVLVQMALGVAIALGVFYLVLLAGRSVAAAVAAGGLVALDPALLFFEWNLLTETLSTLLLLACLLAFAVAVRRRLGMSSRGLAWAALLGLLTAALALTRVSFLALPPLFWAAMVWVARRQQWGRRRAAVVLAVLVGLYLLPVTLWCLRNYRVTGQFTPSTLMGCNLMNHAGAFAEDADSQYDDLKAVFLPVRARVIAESGRPDMAIWPARKEMCRVRGYHPAQLSPVVRGLALSAIRRSPGKYLRSVAGSAGQFWTSNLRYGLGNVMQLLPGWWNQVAYPWALRVWLTALAVLTAAASLAVVVRLRRGGSLTGTEGLIALLVAATLYLWIVSSLAESPNPRYRISAHPLLLATGPLLCARWAARRRESLRPAGTQPR